MTIKKILWLGPKKPELADWLETQGWLVFDTEGALSPEYPILEEVDWLISYGYRHIIRPDVLALFPNRALNLHISYLPWNRGADPNLWSFLEDSPKGVTIHLIDEGLDTGPVLAQREVVFGPGHTLGTSYKLLCLEIESLFMETWPLIAQGQIEAKMQTGEGSFHKVKHKAPFAHLLHSSWETPVADLVGKGIKEPALIN